MSDLAATHCDTGVGVGTDCTWIIFLILILCCCGGTGGFLGGLGGRPGVGGAFDGCSWIWIILILCCCCGGTGFF